MPEIAANMQDFTPEALQHVATEMQKEVGVRLDGAALLREANTQEE